MNEKAARRPWAFVRRLWQLRELPKADLNNLPRTTGGLFVISLPTTEPFVVVSRSTLP
jgi:hypothetical protein